MKIKRRGAALESDGDALSITKGKIGEKRQPGQPRDEVDGLKPGAVTSKGEKTNHEGKTKGKRNKKR